MLKLIYKTDNCRLQFKQDVRVVFVGFLRPGEEGHERPVTATSSGKVAVWDILIKQRRKPVAKLVTEVDLRAESEKFVLSSADLFYSVNTAVRRVRLDSSEEAPERVYSGEEPVCWLCVKEVTDRTWLVISLPSRTLLVSQSQVLAQIPTDGGQRLSVTGDGFLMLMTGGGGTTSVLRTAELWTSTVPVPACSLPLPGCPDTERQAGQARPGRGRGGKSQGETEREEKLISQLSPLLRSGLLSYPSLQRPVIWVGLLGLPRNRKVYLTHCRRHGTDPEDVISSLTAWAPDLQLVPHLSSLLSPFLRLYSGHSTTAMELSLVLLTSFTWLTSYPAPSPPMLTSWRLLAQERPELTGHLSCLGASCRSVFWPALQSGWRSVLPDSDWWRLWDHLVTTGPGLVVPALVALLLCLENTVMACTNLTMLNNLFTSQVALDMTSFLRLSYDLLGKYQHQIQSILLPLPDLSQGLPPPLTLERENREVLTEVNPHHDNLVFIPAKLPARELSPPPVPRLRSNSRQAIIEAAGRGNRQEGDKENRIEVAGPLVPGYPARTEAGLETDLEDITSLLRKAKVLRQVIHSGK